MHSKPMMRMGCALAVALCFAWASPGWSQATKPDAIAAAIAHAGRSSEDVAEDDWRKPQAVLEFLGARPGMQVIDYFAASGYYSELLARVVGPKGGVVVYNNPPYAQFAGEQLSRRFADNRLPNARVLTVPTNELRLPDNSLDAALFVLAYHDLYWQPKDAQAPFGETRQVDADLFRALKPGGVVVVVDHAAASGHSESVADVAATVDAMHRIDPERVKRDFVRAGFVYDGESTALRHPQDDLTQPVFTPALRHKTDQFIYRFRKPKQ